jgi:hypothetical protein
MKPLMTLVVMALLTTPFAIVAATDISTQDQIAQAVSPLPEGMRASATVVYYDAKGEPIVLRQGTGAIVCTTDQHRNTFAVSCYHKILRAQRDIEAKMRTEGKDAKDIQASVQAARDSGRLPRPPQRTMMYMRSGKTEAEAKVLRVMLMPGVTPESTGLPTERGQAPRGLCAPAHPEHT